MNLLNRNTVAKNALLYAFSIGCLGILSNLTIAQTPLVSASLADKGYDAIIETQLDGPVSAAVRNVLKDRNNYKLYRLRLDGADMKREEIDLNSILQTTLPVVCSVDDTKCPTVVLRFKAKDNFESDVAYVFEIKGLASVSANKSDFIPLHIGRPEKSVFVAPKATIINSLDASSSRVRISSDQDVTISESVKVNDTGFKISKDKKQLETLVSENPSSVLLVNDEEKTASSSQTGKEFTVQLGKKLDRSRTHTLMIDQDITDSQGGNVIAKGKIAGTDSPPSPASIKFEVEFKSVAATGIKPFFDLTGKYDAQNSIQVRKNCVELVSIAPCFWQPQFSVDVGLGNTKSKKSIVIDLPFRSLIYNEGVDDTQYDTSGMNKPVPRYYNWRHTGLKSGDILLSFGPKLEFDQTFDKFNALASVRTDFKMTRLLATMKDQRNYLTDPRFGITKDDVALTEIPYGYSLIPYVGIDWGRRTNEEVVNNKGQSTSVAPFSILRAYLGFDSAVEFFLGRVPARLGFAERIWYLNLAETAAFKTDTGVGVRTVRGFHNRASANLDLYLTPARNYAFSLKYENGRDAPSFEYLNKVSVGFKVVY